MANFGKLVDAMRRGGMSRRRFLSAAIALGVGTEEATREQLRRVVQVPRRAAVQVLAVDESACDFVDTRAMSGGTNFWPGYILTFGANGKCDGVVAAVLSGCWS